MTRIDPERVEKLVSSMRHALRLLRELRDIETAEFLADEHRQSSAKYNFIAAIDIANHLISRQQLRAPEDYADTFQVLEEAGVFQPSFAEELVKMARFRNRLVHMYWDVDPSELRRILETRLGDFEAVISCVGDYLKKGEADDAS